MKKVLSFILISLSVLILTGGFFVFKRYQENPLQVFPYPYQFEVSAPAIKLDAPILIVGDRMGSYFAKFKTELAATISQNLTKPIQIQTLARDNFGLHRTLHQLKGLTQWPQIVIYQGASEEFLETKFEISETKTISLNFKRYQDERIQTFLILYPWLSRLVYEPMKRTRLPEVPKLKEEISEAEYLKSLETELLLFEQQLIQMVDLSKDRGSLLILTTTPINLDIPPKRICQFTTVLELEKEILGLEQLMKAGNFKSAFQSSSKLIKQYTGNAKLYFLHGQIARKLNKIDQGKNSILESSAYDCMPWRANEVHNSIIRKVARQKQVPLFDFSLLVTKEWAVNTTYFDEIHPQNIYYERGMQQLGLVIKNILKL